MWSGFSPRLYPKWELYIYIPQSTSTPALTVSQTASYTALRALLRKKAELGPCNPKGNWQVDKCPNSLSNINEDLGVAKVKIWVIGPTVIHCIWHQILLLIMVSNRLHTFYTSSQRHIFQMSKAVTTTPELEITFQPLLLDLCTVLMHSVLCWELEITPAPVIFRFSFHHRNHMLSSMMSHTFLLAAAVILDKHFNYLNTP